ncbi:MAG: outer membrane beta-barrel domain-containing protein [Bdellovibrionota bacterium]
MRFGIVFCLLLTVFAARAEDVLELPEEELARESVTPIFDRMVSTKNRNIVTVGKWDVGGYYGWSLTEPIYSDSKLGANIYYNTSEVSAWGVTFNKNMGGLSTYANQLRGEYRLNFEKAPAPEYSLLLDYNIKAFYGKMSFGKDTVVNTQMFGSAAIGTIKYTNKAYPASAIGIGEKFYFTKNVALRVDLRLYIHQAPIPFKGGAKTILDPPGAGSTSAEFEDFEERLHFTSVLDVGMSYLF